MIFLSLKTYQQSTGDQAIKLSRIIKKVLQKTQVPIIPAIQSFDIYRIRKEVGIEIWAQHLDPIDPGRHFGWLSPHTAKIAGASGTVINHGEHPINFTTIKKTIEKCQQYHLKTLVIVDSLKLAKKVVKLKPDYLAFEYPDLIGGNLAMIDADPQTIKKVINLSSIPVIIGAGIKTKQHVQKTIKLGGQGVILASGVVLADNPEKVLTDLASGFQLPLGLDKLF